jgi:hypothetical protein
VNGADHQHRQQTPQTYLNQVNVHKHHTPQHTVPVQSAYLSSPPNSRNGLSPSSTNIYHFSQHNSQQVKFFFSKKGFISVYFRFQHLPPEEEVNQDIIIHSVKMRL